MPCAEFIVESVIETTFRTAKVKGMFDVDVDKVVKSFNVDIPIENKPWNVGLIVGASGTGKSTIAKTAFKEFEYFEGFDWGKKSIIDAFAERLTPKQITEALSKVGFSSPPDWLKPFAVLSTGQKMRAELARLILECDKPVIYDEFTSVVDREVAKIGSAAIQKFIRKNDKQFIAVSCHYDINEWLEPDWLYDVNDMTFTWGRLRRPDITVNIRRGSSREWGAFKEFHYLSAKHNNAAHIYVAEINETPVAWCSVLHFPHPKVKGMKRVHRIVVKPDYQGIGVGGRLLREVGDIYLEQGLKFSLVTSTPALIHSLKAHKHWVMTRKPGRLKITARSGVLAGSTSDERLTASFRYIGENKTAA